MTFNSRTYLIQMPYVPHLHIPLIWCNDVWRAWCLIIFMSDSFSFRVCFRVLIYSTQTWLFQFRQSLFHSCSRSVIYDCSLVTLSHVGCVIDVWLTTVGRPILSFEVPYTAHPTLQHSSVVSGLCVSCHRVPIWRSAVLFTAHVISYWCVCIIWSRSVCELWRFVVITAVLIWIERQSHDCWSISSNY